MTSQEFLHELEEAIGSQTDSIQGDESLNDLEGWDSMAVVAFIAMADERLGTLVAPAQIAACKTVADLAAMFPSKIF